jgi:hypothetical protein
MCDRKFCKWVVISTTLLLSLTVFAQDGKVRVRVEPKETYIFIDGVPYGWGNHSYKIASGSHTIGAYNYGFKPQVRDVKIDPNTTTELEFKLDAVVPADVKGPWGRIQIEGASVFAVLLNGKTPDYFVGHGDEFNHGGAFLPCCIQELVVPPGTHQVTLVYRDWTLWSGTVTVNANERVILNAHNGNQKVKPWKNGDTVGTLPRFTAGTASATIAIAAVSGNLTAQSGQINCGDSTQLNWTTADTVERTITPAGEKQSAETGSETVSPTKNTTYVLQASGPGGTITSNATVDVNTAVQSSLQSSQNEVRYRQIGDKVIEQGSTDLSWSATNANSVTIESMGPVSNSDRKTIKAQPQQTSEGNINETQTYKLIATNQCGGSDTQTVSVRIVGSIEPVPDVPLVSVFFPTGYPDRRHPDVGLVPSEQARLQQTAEGFKKYLEYDPDARLSVVGNTDVRDSQARNKPLSQRRADRVKQYLTSIGVPEDKIDTVAQGKEHPLDATTVKTLHEQNPNKAPNSWGDFQDLWWAYNRRADVVLLPKGVQSSQYYPGNAPEAKLLYSPEWPGTREVVTMASEKTAIPANTDSAPPDTAPKQ